MYSVAAKQTYISLYEMATEKLASVYLPLPAEVQESQEEEQSNETTTER